MDYKLNGDNFKTLQTQFQKETGVSAGSNMSMYIAWYHAHFADLQAQVLNFILMELGKKK